jgi:charged multivesicular body protein 3
MPLFGLGGSRQTQAQKAKEVAAEGKRELRSEGRQIDRELRKIQQEEAKLKQQIEAQAKQGNTACVQTLAKQLVQSRKATGRLEKVQSTIGTTSTQLTCAAAGVSVAASMETSAKIMKDIGAVVDVQGLEQNMSSMRREMAKAEMAEELVDEGFAAFDDEDEVDAEMNRVLEELEVDTQLLMAKPGMVPAYMAPGPAAGYTAAAPVPQQDALAVRLAALQAA